MEELTADEIAEIFSAAGDSVFVINQDENFAAWQTRNSVDKYFTESDFKDMIKRNVEHLELIKDIKKTDGTTSIWTSEDFTDIDAAITAGKKLY